ncbi:MAG: nucleoside hydrolase [Sphaerochaeta sp.]
MKKKIILDVDTGLDDAAALFLAAGLEELEIVAVIATAGNVGLDKTIENTLNIMETVHYTGPVYAGSSSPLVRESVEAGDFHGESGLDGPVFEPRKIQTLQEEDGVSALIRLVKENPQEITIISVGPLTDVARALKKEPSLPSLVKEIVIMGGSFSGGNVTEAAEFNTYADPEAAQIVFSSGAPLALLSLDITRTVTLSKERLDGLKAIGGRSSEVYSQCMDTYMGNYASKKLGWPQMHDPLCVAYVLDRTKFSLDYAHVTVDIDPTSATYGETRKESTNNSRGVTIPTDIDRAWFWSLVERSLKSLP